MSRAVDGASPAAHAELVDVPETRYVSVGDADVAYQTYGSGPTDLVFLSGVGNVDTLWDYPLTATGFWRLGSFCRVIVFDRRGFGGSDPVPDDRLPRWERWIEDLNAVLDAVGSERAAILGQLDAGPTAILFAATQPARATALILANTTARYMVADDYPIGVAPESVDLLVEALQSTWGSSDGARLFNPDATRDDPQYVRFVARYMRSAFTPRSVAAYYGSLLRDLDVRSALSSIQVPTLVLHRRDFSIVPLEHARFLAANIAGARLVEIAGRDPQLIPGGAAPVLDEIEEFLTGVRPVPLSDRVLATVLMTDIVESTSRTASVGDRAWRDLLDRHDAIVRTELDRHRGKKVNSIGLGDGVLATFDGPARACRCAAALHESIRSSLGVDIRAGLHCGEIELRGDDVTGMAVNIAARVTGLASANETLVSRTVTDLVAGSGLEFEERGEHELKGVPGKMTIYAVRP